VNGSRLRLTLGRRVWTFTGRRADLLTAGCCAGCLLAAIGAFLAASIGLWALATHLPDLPL
jgi:hypothetical protein